MSVAAMTMDDQRPLVNTYEKMSNKYEQSLHVGSVSGNGGGGGTGGASGPASPTPSVSEEPTTSAPHQYHHHISHPHSHHHHHHQQTQQNNQQPPQYHRHHQQTLSSSAEQQQQSTPPSPSTVVIPNQEPLQKNQQLQQQDQQQQTLPITIAETVAAAEERQRLLEDEIESLKTEQLRLSQQCADAQRREKILMRRLANKEQEFQDYVSQIAEFKAAQAPSAVALRSALLDPAVNLLFEKLKKELKATKAKLEETQNELSAWKFTPDSNTGKRLMAKCRLLYQENEELGKMTSNGRLAKLETELAMQKSFSEEVKKSQSELDDFLQELDEDVEGMQSTILFLQQELKTTRDRIQVLEKDNYQLKNGNNSEDVKIGVEYMGAISHSHPHSGINGNTTPNLNVNDLPYNPPIHLSAPIVNELKFSSTPLDTINENSYLHTPHGVGNNEFYNGTIEQQPSAITPFGDDGSNSSNNSVNLSKLRTAASRKRNYDELDSNENVSIVNVTTIATMPPTPMPQVSAPQVSTPRTLPPKKSKLRVTPVRRASEQSIENNENEATNLITVAPMAVVGLNVGVTENMAIVDNAVVGMANEEIPNSVGSLIVDDTTVDNNGMAVQRIMTRRRSVRLQQNGGNVEC